MRSNTPTYVGLIYICPLMQRRPISIAELPVFWSLCQVVWASVLHVWMGNVDLLGYDHWEKPPLHKMTLWLHKNVELHCLVCQQSCIKFWQSNLVSPLKMYIWYVGSLYGWQKNNTIQYHINSNDQILWNWSRSDAQVKDLFTHITTYFLSYLWWYLTLQIVCPGLKTYIYEVSASAQHSRSEYNVLVPTIGTAASVQSSLNENAHNKQACGSSRVTGLLLNL